MPPHRARNDAIWRMTDRMLPADSFVSGEPEDPATLFFNLCTEAGELLLTEDDDQLVVEEAFYSDKTGHGLGRSHS